MTVKPLAWFATLLLVASVTGCATPPPPSADLSQPGWTLRQGQAVWTPRRGEPAVAGELLAASHPDGSTFVQFAKPPFTLATASQTPARWRLELPTQRVRRHGSGVPPADSIWFQLARTLDGSSAEAGWVFSRAADGLWALWHPETGERLEGYLQP